ncbi:DUF6361 family protein [Thioalkalivibrio sp. AKL8]|uniref:DUF6361 family protein n=1 Tax=Thioalkalivibrio sp. AKL8 TaxID=1158156 RepID=UPI00035C0F67|nr:DUF6361 family protein [Thioalkalivibrio sp. AKL8]
MQSQLGWTQISRTAVQRAESQLATGAQGVVDELGLLRIHQHYADRFFPGTSVLHTRLRYVLFVAWIFDDLWISGRNISDPEEEIARRELQVAKALKKNDSESSVEGWGLIGRNTLPRMPSQRPSMTYWSALGRWGILHRHRDGSVPTRSEVVARLKGASSAPALHDAEGRWLAGGESPFVSLPPRPPGWDSGGKLGFRLEEKEREFLRDVLEHVFEPESARRSLFGRLAQSRAGADLAKGDGLYCDRVRNELLDEQEKEVLQQARYAAALAAVVRAVYLALVEETAVHTDGLGKRDVCRKNLQMVVGECLGDAQQLELKSLRTDLRPLDRGTQGVLDVMKRTRDWLRETGTAGLDLKGLFEPYRKQEVALKGGRARLGALGRERRKEWWLDKARSNESRPGSLHYRWWVATNLLRDLEDTA